MAFDPGRLSVFKLDTAAPTLTDISAYCDNIDMPEEIGMGETTTFGKTAKVYGVVTLTDGTISITGKWDPTIDAHLAGIKGIAATQTFEYYPSGEDSGDAYYTGECRLSNYSRSSPVGGVVTFSATLQISDTISRSTV